MPERSGPDEDADAERNFCAAIDKVSDVFGRQKRAASTADEHRGYMRLIAGWLVRRGHGSYVECITNESGRLVEVRARLGLATLFRDFSHLSLSFNSRS